MMLISRRTILVMTLHTVFCIAATAQTTVEFLDPQFIAVRDSVFSKYVRTISHQADSSYHVQVKYKTGEVMMEGNYSDREISVENGDFTYFYANGLVESKGKFRNGTKVGTWKRWNYDGRAKPDRFYPDENFKRSNRTTSAARFPGGMNSLRQLVDDSLFYPVEAMQRKIQGTVYVTFMIDEAGDVCHAEVSEGVHYLLDEEAIRFISNMPCWSPAMRHGVPIDSSFIMPITFDIQAEQVKYDSSAVNKPSPSKPGSF